MAMLWWALVVVARAYGESTGLVWLAEGCSGSTALLKISTQLVKAASPRTPVVGLGEVWHTRDNPLEQVMLNESKYSIAKIQPMYLKKESPVDFRKRPLPFTLVAMARSNVLDFLVCALRDDSAHGMCDSFKLYSKECLHAAGHLVDEAGRAVEPSKSWFENRHKLKADRRVHLNTTTLISALELAYLTQRNDFARILNRFGAPTTVFESSDLLDWSSDAKVETSARAWQMILTLAGLHLELDDILAELVAMALHPPECAIAPKIANYEEVASTIRRHKSWTHVLDC